MKATTKIGFLSLIIFMIIGLIVSAFNNLIGQGIATIGFIIIILTLAIDFNYYMKKSEETCK